MPGPGTFELRSEMLGSLPVINYFLARMGMEELLEQHLPHDDARLRLAPATVIALVLRNLVVAHQPVYALGEWAAPYQPGLLGLGRGDVAAVNDDRVGRMLDRLFDTDRASLITGVVLRAVREFGVELSQLHNDSTTVTFSGNYRGATGGTRGGKTTVAITYGHNKDHRPDLKQLLYVLTISADGAVPIAFRTETATPPMTSPISPPGTNSGPSSAGRTSCMWPTASWPTGWPWTTSPATVAVSSPSCPAPAAKTPSSGTGSGPSTGLG